MKIILTFFTYLLLVNTGVNDTNNFKDQLNDTLKKNKAIAELSPGEAAVINIWATWCGPCIKEIPEMNELVQEYKNRNVRFLAFSNETMNTYKSFLKRRPDFQFDYEISFGDTRSINLLKAQDKQRGGTAIPIHILINKDGDVEQVFIGASPANIQKIKTFLDKQASAK
ncbi:thiol-disulfide isomerase-like thioredoxin [Belliella baltica DSM 15883]|uniref:Thiol-disulfide isomerase-like thioredoxin n=1 Tax=Belliella baltica (strain DSM 15883 / CIP 108006 / LMG 21964 / BA134) TaxID=866536 RepID=I3Z0X4_BELBD|nr:TlpA disulfide reductase family protein [Belliella baltica]AFL82892.1 thiol-disulfide isomerase-like thioredoxin [Belliella baltica DSM 15883]